MNTSFKGWYICIAFLHGKIKTFVHETVYAEYQDKAKNAFLGVKLCYKVMWNHIYIYIYKYIHICVIVV